MNTEADLTAAIQALVGDLSAALNNHDVAAFTALFSESGFLLAPSKPVIKGHADIATLWDNTLKNIQAFEFTVFNVKAFGADHARAVGRLTLRSGGQQQMIVSKYLLAAEKGDQAWKIESFIWNRVQTQGGRQAGQGQQTDQHVDGPSRIGDLYSN
ncbi:YybH family protein [Methylovirgula sp. 4M-Z18]|uniref:YybH family protein n=1 Tax=Methylovirgula sp. 4M-Z18 TaxID=2293567 RepID=UPI000E2EC12A|nr:nuclear transport factor 2 family protein [Methylovirgula sp. 4M-Z18]RFB77940.1 SgcJ/EcaC family oxidoreductase [Methylovirgula sp. 4M-Z18]